MATSFRWLTPESQLFLSRGYLLPGQTVDERIDIICARAEELLKMPGYGARLKHVIQRGWLSLSTPIWTNFGHPTRGLPISCFGSDIEDSIEGIFRTASEVAVMTKHGGGTSASFGKVRGRGALIKDNGTSEGTLPFIGHFNSVITVVSQGNTRRGSFAAYLPIEHPDILEFLKIKEAGNDIQEVFPGVVVSDAFMERVVARDREAMKVWAAVLDSGSSAAYPYIIFQRQRVARPSAGLSTVAVSGMQVKQSNLCTEIMLPSNNERESFVC
jgi:ribonucleoside-diphosphate reductase alpha chain